jgi:hypothetical protein
MGRRTKINHQKLTSICCIKRTNGLPHFSLKFDYLPQDHHISVTRGVANNQIAKKKCAKLSNPSWILTCPWHSSPSSIGLHRSSLPTCVGIHKVMYRRLDAPKLAASLASEKQDSVWILTCCRPRPWWRRLPWLRSACKPSCLNNR